MINLMQKLNINHYHNKRIKRKFFKFIYFNQITLSINTLYMKHFLNSLQIFIVLLNQLIYFLVYIVYLLIKIILDSK